MGLIIDEVSSNKIRFFQVGSKTDFGIALIRSDCIPNKNYRLEYDLYIYLYIMYIYIIYHF